MMSHLAVPGLGDGQTAASINPAAYKLAREHRHFEGPSYTDDLGGMASLSDALESDRDAVIEQEIAAFNPSRGED